MVYLENGISNKCGLVLAMRPEVTDTRFQLGENSLVKTTH